MSRLSVLQISSGFAIEGPSGGLGRFALELSRNLDQTRVEPILCGLWDHGTEREQQRLDQLCREGIEAFIAAPFNERAPYQQFWKAYRSIKAHLRDRNVDVLHSHDQFGDVMTLLLKPTLRPKAIIRTVHNEREWVRRPLRRILLTDLVYPLAFNLEVGVSQQVVDNLNTRRLARLLNRQAVKIYNSLNLDRFVSSTNHSVGIREEMGIMKEDILLCSIGRLATQKGYEFLIEAMQAVTVEVPSARLMIVGDGPLREALIEKAKRFGLQNIILFTGKRSDIESILSGSDLFISSSLWEGLPTVIIESMAARTPVIATDVSGTRELIQDGITGYLVEPGNAQALGRKIITILDNMMDTKAVVDRAHTEIIERFSISEAAKEYINLYRSSVK